MKKTLIALAALAATASFAQSSVTISGGMALGFGTTKLGDTSSKTEMRRQTGNIAFKGTEDLGGGLKAGFEVQTTVGTAADTSMAASAPVLGDRGAYLTLSGAFGTVLAGNAASGVRSQFGSTGDVSQLSVVNGLSAGASTAPTSGSFLTAAGDASARVIYGDAYSKYVAYATPTFNGFSASIALAPNRGNDSDQYNDKETKSYGLSYANGPLAVNYNLTDAAQTTSTAGAVSGAYKLNTLTASYDFGIAKVGFTNQTIKLASGTNPGNGNALTVSVPVGAGNIGFGTGKRGVSSSSDTRFGDEVKQNFVGYRYNLSKRTNVQVVYNKIDREGATATNDVKETHVLLAHTF